MPLDAALVLDSLLISSIAGGALLATCTWVTRRGALLTGDARHQVLWGGLLTVVGIFALTLLLAPGPTGCLTAPCGVDSERAALAGQTQEYHTLAAAGKFSDLAPGRVAALVSRAAPGPREAIVGLWIAGIVYSLLRIGRRRWLARAFVRGTEPVGSGALADRLSTLSAAVGLARSVRLRRHPSIDVPMVTGTVRPVLLLPSGFESRPGTEIDMVFLHELAHLRRRDGLATLLGELATAVFWFHPIVRRASRRMRDLQEIAADSSVLESGVRPSQYADFLLRTFRDLTGHGAPLSGIHAITGTCLMETRLQAILDRRSSHRPASRPLTAAIATSFVAVGVALSFAPAALQAGGLLPTASRQEGGIDRSLLHPAALDSILRPVIIDRMADRYVAGAAVSIVHEGNVVYQAGFGRREVYDEVPVDPERTIWRIGSITKVLTGVAVMQLVDRGLLDVDADVNDYLTELRIESPFDEPIRVRHLLTHTAGFDQIGLGRHVSSRAEVRPLGEFLAENLLPIRPPGEVSSYDTYAITLAGYLVGQLSGRTYERYLLDEILGPLSMDRSGIVVPPALEDDVAVGYGFAGSWEAQRWEFMNTDPASTVNSTVTDMANFMTMLLDGGVFEGRRVLSESSARAMLTRQYTNHPDHPGYGYTFFEDRSYGVPAFSHGGSMTGYGAFLYLVPEHRLGVFVAVNQESGTIANAVLSALIRALFPGRDPSPELRSRLSPGPDVSRFTGTYASNMYHHTDPTMGWRPQPFELGTDEAGRLVFGGAPAFPVGRLAFQRDDGLLLTFRENARGEITHFFVNQTVYERMR